MRFEALQHAVRTHELDVGEFPVVDRTVALFELFGADRVAEDVVADVVAEQRHLAARARRAPPQRRVHPQRVLGAEIRIANLEGEVAGMRTEEIHLLERRVPRGARQAQRDGQLVAGSLRPDQQARRILTRR